MKREPLLPNMPLTPGPSRNAPRRPAKAAGRNDEFPGAGEFFPEKITLKSLRLAARTCEGCPLYKNATQSVFGEGPADANAMLIGEQPGDQEDLAGKPFVGPAGKLLDEVLAQVGIDRESLYVTNAVKHFKFEQRGERRIHSKPSARDVAACAPWLSAEIEMILPRYIVCLGATAAQALLGKEFRITRDRGRVFTQLQQAPWVMATLHPSALLRIPDADQRRAAREQFAEDLRTFASALAGDKGKEA